MMQVLCAVLSGDIGQKNCFFLLAGAVRLTIWGQWGVSLPPRLFSHKHTQTNAGE